MSRLTPGQTGPSNLTPSLLTTLSMTSSSPPRSMLKAARVQSTLKSMLNQTRLDSNLPTKSNIGSIFLKADLSIPRLNPATTSNSTSIMELLKDGIRSGISTLLLTLLKPFQTQVFVWEQPTKASIATLIIDLKLISKMTSIT